MSDADPELRVLAVVCHPADAIDGAGGTLALHARRGDRVTVVVCTHGVDTHDLERSDTFRHHRDRAILGHDESLGRKEQEVANGLGVLGIDDVRFLRFPDDLLMVTPELVEALADQIADVQPHLMVLHNPAEELGIADVGHADSAVAALKARYLANSPRFLGDRPAPDRVYPAQIFFLTMNGKTTSLTAEGQRWGDVLVDITPVVDLKVVAMDRLASQYYPGDLARKCIEAVNGRMGLHARLPYAEAFQSYYPNIHDRLPANPGLLAHASHSAQAKTAPMRIMVTDVEHLMTDDQER